MTLTVFYALMSVLMTFAVALILLPFFKTHRFSEKDKVSNAQLVKSRLRELNREAAEGLLSQDALTSAEQELKLAFVDEHQEAATRRGAANIAVAVGLIVALCAGGIVYWQVNHLDEVNNKASSVENLAELSAKLLEPDAMSKIQPSDIQNLALAIRLKLQQEPDDAQGWMFLGRLRMALNQLQEAIPAFERSLEINPQSTMTRVALAQALMMSNSEAGLKRAQAQLAYLLKNDQANDNLVLMMAVTSAQLGDVETARPYYEKIRNKLEPNNPVRTQLDAQLLGHNSEYVDSNADNVDKLVIDVTVDIDDDVRERVPGNAWLTVFVRPQGQSKGMPLAVKRLQVSSWPQVVSISDADAMVPDLQLSQFDAYTVTARVSNSQDVMAKPGDIEGAIPVSRDKLNQTHTLKINKELL